VLLLDVVGGSWGLKWFIGFGGLRFRVVGIRGVRVVVEYVNQFSCGGGTWFCSGGGV